MSRHAPALRTGHSRLDQGDTVVAVGTTACPHCNRGGVRYTMEVDTLADQAATMIRCDAPSCGLWFAVMVTCTAKVEEIPFPPF